MPNFREQMAEEVKEAASASENGEEQREELEQVEVDFGSIPFVKVYPTTLISGVFPEDEGNPIIRFPDEENNEHRYQGYLGLVMDDLELVTDEDEGFDEAFIAKTSEEDSTEFRVVDGSDDQTSFKYEGEQVNISSDKYDIEERQTSIDGRAILVVDRTAARSVARKLDVNGDTYAGMDEETGQPNGGLIEYAPDDVDAPVDWQYTRTPELRGEFYGARVGLMTSRRSEVDEDYAEAVNDPDDPTRDMMWYTVFDMESGETVEPTTGEPVRRSWLEWNFDPTAGHLPDDQWEFVQEYQSQGLPTDEETIISNIEDNADQFEDEPNVERMARLIESGAGE